MRTTIVSMLFISCLLGNSASCTDANAGSNLGEDKLASSIMALDYSQAIDDCTFVTFDSDASEKTGFAGWWLNGMEGCIGRGVPDRPFSENEKRALGLWRLPNGSVSFWAAVKSEISVYYAKHGEMPATGVSLFPELWEESGYAELIALSDEEVLNRYRAGIDPITGRFYSSFSSEGWCAGAMNVTVIEDEAEIAELYPDMYIQSGSDEEGKGIMRPSQIWRIVIYGEEEGSIILDDIVVN